MKKLKLILTSSAILIAVIAAVALRETKQDPSSILSTPAARAHQADTCSHPCK